jgi:hypothetical protein
MNLPQETLDRLPEGEAIECSAKPVLTQAHTRRLRKLWSYGRPVHVSDLGGIDLDLIVHGFAETVDKGYNSTAVLTITKRGVVHLNEARQLLIAAQRPHHQLGERLAHHLQDKGMHTWENVEFSNPDNTQPKRWGVVRPDVFACLPALKAENAAPAIYEVKVSRADFLADLAKPEKREAYTQLAEAVYYCCPAGLIDKAEVPDGFGLLVEAAPGAFELKKKARRQKNFVLSVNTAMTLMVKRQMPLDPID